MRPEVNLDLFEISDHFEKLLSLHGNFTTAIFQSTVRS